MKHKVTHIIDGDTFEVTPNWEWNGQTGNSVRPKGYNTPELGEPGYNEAKEKLAGLILNKEIELKNPVGLSYERLLCDVYINGQDLSDLMAASRVAPR